MGQLGQHEWISPKVYDSNEGRELKKTNQEEELSDKTENKIEKHSIALQV